jgi:hypothetical protein
MATFRSYNDIVTSFLEYLRLVQPQLDTKPGTVARDLFVDGPSQEMSNLYSELRNVSNLQSLFSTSGANLSRLASNFNIKKGTGTAATGVATLTTNNMDVDVLIQQNSILTSRNGLTFKITENVLMSSNSKNVYRANASRIKQELSLAGITDEFAIDVNVEAIVTGKVGNIGRFTLTTHNITGITNVTNLATFTGGTNAESDTDLRNRVLSVFAGSNTGTSLGYETALSVLSGVSDSIVVVPGDPLMTRDGTQVEINSSGSRVVVSEGTGGKVDIYVLGSSLQSQIDSFIFNDQSGKGDVTDASNDVVLGQQTDSSGVNVSQRRVEALSTGVVPYQPAESITSVVGSSSGSNFVAKYTDSLGAVRGNYELLKDSGDYGGSPFGFDKLHWISDQIELDEETVAKGQFNGTDALRFTDVREVRSITQDILVTNENSYIDPSSRSTITVLKTPVRSVNRVTNTSTGERYAVSNQNVDGVAGELNTTGRITISGGTLPAATDVLQVDYVWVKAYDSVLDFDNLADFNVNRSAQDSVDWGVGNLIRNEQSVITTDVDGNLIVELTHPISRVVSVNRYHSWVDSVPSSGIATLEVVVDNVIDAKRVLDNYEVFNTDKRNGTITGNQSVILPTDAVLLPYDPFNLDNDKVTFRYNADNLFARDGYSVGTFAGQTIHLDNAVGFAGEPVLVNYVADVNVLLAETSISSLPVVRSGNNLLLGDAVTGWQPTTNVLSGSTPTQNQRTAPSNIKMTVGSIPSNGTITVYGTSSKKLANVLVTMTSGDGLTIDLASAIKTDLGVSSVPTTVKISRLYKVEKVKLNSSKQVESVEAVYDVTNYRLLDATNNLDVAIQDSGLGATQVGLPLTTINTANLLVTGDVVRVTFYYTNTSDLETLYFSRNGLQVTNKQFTTITRIASNYGFKNVSGDVVGTVLIGNMNQPVTNTSYYTSYDYKAPKENERVTVTFNYNSLMSDATNAIESVRPITADVLVKEAAAKSIDVRVKIVLQAGFENQQQTVIENARDSITSFLTSNSLGTTVDASDVVNRLYSVSGVDRVQIIFFGLTGGGNVLSISAERNEYLNAGTINVEVEVR